MKNQLLTLSFLCLLLSSCKKDDKETIVEIEPTIELAEDYTQLAIGNYWVYDRYSINISTGEETDLNQLDSIFISKDTLINGLTYLVLEGTKFGNKFQNILRNKEAKLVFPDESIQLSTMNLPDTINVEYDLWNGIVDSMYTVLNNQEVGIDLPSGIVTSKLQYEKIFYISSSLNPIRYQRNYYVINIGVAKYTSFFATGPSNLEMRLIRYSVK